MINPNYMKNWKDKKKGKAFKTEILKYESEDERRCLNSFLKKKIERKKKWCVFECID